MCAHKLVNAYIIYKIYYNWVTIDSSPWIGLDYESKYDLVYKTESLHRN